MQLNNGFQKQMIKDIFCSNHSRCGDHEDSQNQTVPLTYIQPVVICAKKQVKLS